ncbi:MAG: hypothetical protein NVSMB39_5920 [Candidatus Saccharimonadales bacterium]
MAAAAAIYGRFQAATHLDPNAVTVFAIEELRALGLSRGKAGYIQDLAQRAVVKLYGHQFVPPNAELVKLTEAWAAYRTVASWHLWYYLDNSAA